MEIDDLMDYIEDAIWYKQEENDLGVIETIKTFKNAMLLTDNEGLIIKCDDGSEFQATFVKSK